MDKDFSVVNVFGYDVDAIKEIYGDELQMIFAKNFFIYPERYTYKGLTLEVMDSLGMLDELNSLILGEAIRQWDDNQQEIYGAWEDEPLDSRVTYFEDIAYNWS